MPSTSVIDPDFTDGWFKRGYNWRATASVEQQIGNRFAVAATYARAIYGNFIVTDNLNLTPAEFDPYCITVPVDPRIPRSGQQLCGLYDQRINVATSNLIGFADNYVDKYQVGNLEQGPQTEHFNGFDVQLIVALPAAARSPVAGARATRFRTPPFRPTAARSTTAAPIASSWTTRSSSPARCRPAT